METDIIFLDENITCKKTLYGFSENDNDVTIEYLAPFHVGRVISQEYTCTITKKDSTNHAWLTFKRKPDNEILSKPPYNIYIKSKNTLITVLCLNGCKDIKDISTESHS